MTVRDKKRELIKKYVDQDPAALAGFKITRVCVLVIFLMRLALTIYDTVYLLLSELKPAPLSYVFFVFGLLVCYMMFDGNRAMGYILFIAAMVRVLYHFVSVAPTLPEGVGATVFTVITLAVLLSQAVLSLFPTINQKGVAYSNAMQKVNLLMQDVIRNSNGRK